MSNSGKTGSIRKENFSNQKIGAVGFDRIEFYHKASAGDTIIDLSALVTPTTELAGSGFSQPSPSDLLAAGIKAKQNSFKLINSQGQELMNRIAYTIVDNSTIRLADAALEGEIFHGVIDGSVKNLVQLPETQTIVATGTLAEGATTFSVGASFRTEVNPLTQLGEILVYRNGILMFRNVSNAVAAVDADGNYEEVPIGNGFSNEIEFNIAGDVGGEAIHIVSPTRIIKDDGTLLQQVQTLQGVIDIMRDDLVNEFQFPATRYDGFSSDVDLRAFNNRVITNESDISTLQGRSWNSSDFYEESSHTGTVIHGGTQDYELVRIGKVVHLTSTNFSTATSTSSTSAVFIPANMRPSATVHHYTNLGSRTENCLIRINTDGTITATNDDNAGVSSSASVPTFSVSWQIA